MLFRLSTMAKAIVAAAAAAAGSLAVAAQDGALDTSDLITIALSALGALGVTWAVPNK